MSGDRLAQMQDRAEFIRGFIEVDTDQAGGFLDELSGDVLALVEIAKAARRVIDADNQSLAAHGEEGMRALREMESALAALREALQHAQEPA